jgi:hypothetical protein
MGLVARREAAGPCKRSPLPRAAELDTQIPIAREDFTPEQRQELLKWESERTPARRGGK